MKTGKALLKKKCVPCEGGVPRLFRVQAKAFLKETPGWKLAGNAKSIRKEYVMKDFLAAVKFVNRIADISERENHHPDIFLTRYRRLAISLYTHAIGGLSENDFILAAKIEKAAKHFLFFTS